MPSAVLGLEFLGQVSKTFVDDRNTANPKNNTNYILPVRFDYLDRQARFHFE
jgi:hypothetical protein